MVIFAKKKTEMNLFEVNKSSDIGLEPVREFNLYGKIQVLLLFRYKVSLYVNSPGTELFPFSYFDFCLLAFSQVIKDIKNLITAS